MNKSELISDLAEALDTTKTNAATIIEALFDPEGGIISSSLQRGEKVSIQGFGAFEVRERAERDGYNPAKGEAIRIAAAKVPAFKAGSILKAAIKGA